MKVKDFYDQYVIPFFKKVIPELFESIFKNFFTTVGKFLWSHLMASLFAVSVGGLVVETAIVVHVVSVADHASELARADVAKANSDLKLAQADLASARADLARSTATVADQLLTIEGLQAKVRQLSQTGTGLAVISGQIEVGEHGLADLIDRGLELTRLAQRQAQGSSSPGR